MTDKSPAPSSSPLETPRKRFRVLTPSGVIADGFWERREDIPARIPDRGNHYFDTDDAGIIEEIVPAESSPKPAESPDARTWLYSKLNRFAENRFADALAGAYKDYYASWANPEDRKAKKRHDFIENDTLNFVTFGEICDWMEEFRRATPSPEPPRQTPDFSKVMLEILQKCQHVDEKSGETWMDMLKACAILKREWNSRSTPSGEKV